MAKIGWITKLALASVAALPTVAQAGDGFYMGLAGVYVEGDGTSAHNMTTGSFYANDNAAAITAAPVDDLSHDVWGASILAGYEVHLGESVLGAIEADATVFDGETTDEFTGPYPNYSQTVFPFSAYRFTIAQSVSQQWVSTIRAKLGFDLGPSIVFVTAGAAFSDLEFIGTFSDNATAAGCGGNPACTGIPLQGASDSKFATGWALGGGVDIPVSNSTKFRIEYMHHDFGSLAYSRTLTRPVTFGVTAPVLSGETEVKNDMIRVGFTWGL